MKNHQVVPAAIALAVLLVGGSSLRAADDLYNGFSKGIFYQQSSAGTPSVQGYGANIDVEEDDVDTVTNVTITGSTAVFHGVQDTDDGFWNGSQSFASKAALDAAFPNGTYTMTVDTQNDGTHTLTLPLLSDSYPNAPHLTNYAALQNAPQTPFTLTWDAFSGGTTADFMDLRISDSDGNEFYDISNREYVAGSAVDPNFNGTATGILLPLNLDPGQYTIDLVFGKVLGTDQSLPDVVSEGFEFAQTEFSINVAPVPEPASLAMIAAGAMLGLRRRTPSRARN